MTSTVAKSLNPLRARAGLPPECLVPVTAAFARAFVAALIALVALATAVPAGAFDLRIGTRTRLDVKNSVEGTLVQVDGHLRDNVGQGIGGEIVTIEFERKVNATGVTAVDVRTDRTGRFYHTQRLGTGVYKGQIHYAGREHYYSASDFEFSVEARQGVVAVGLEAPRFVTAGSGIAVRVLATSGDRPVPDLPVTVTLGPRSADVKTGKNGTALATLSAAAVDGKEIVIEARFPGDMDFGSAAARTTVRVLTRPAWAEFTASQVRQRLRRGVRTSGVFADASGPVARVPVEIGLRMEGRDVQRFTAVTDDAGRFDVFVPEGNLQAGPHEVQALAVVGSTKVESEVQTVEVSRTGSGAVAWVLGVVLALCLLVLAGFMARELLGDVRRRRPRTQTKRPRQSLEAARSPRILALDDPPPQDLSVAPDGTSIAGITSDAQTRDPVGGARVAVHDDEGEVVVEVATDARGVFRFSGLLPGRYELQTRCKGYVSAAHQFSIPHSGALAWFRFPLTPVRVVVRDLFEALVEDLSAQENPWGRLTPRQTVRMLLAAVRAPGGPAATTVPEGYQAFRERLSAVLAARQTGSEMTADDVVSAVVEVLEEVYYSHRLHDEAVATIMERLTEDVRRRAEVS